MPLLSKEKDRSEDPPQTLFNDVLETELPSDKYIKDYSRLSFLAFADLFPYIRKINSQSQEIEEKDLPLPFDHNNVERKILSLD